MLEIRTVSWRNFMSYGDYTTTIDLENLGQCIITGEVIGDDKEAYDSSNLAPIKKSNGAGKSTIPSVIQWVLFGRTMHSPQPGSKVVNWYTGNECWGKIEFKSGDSITRTRSTDGANELIYIKDGDEHRLSATTLSTATQQQKQLTRDFGLDWELFCGSVFFNQYSKPWMEMADQVRKKAMERALHVDRFQFRADVAKRKFEKLEGDIESQNQSVELTDREIKRLEQVLERLKQSKAEFDSGRHARKQQLLTEATKETAKRDAIKLPDIDKLKAKWAIVSKIQEILRTTREKVNEASEQISSLVGTQRQLQSTIDSWQQKQGKLCTQCEQEIPSTHVQSKIEPLHTKLAEINAEINRLTDERQALKKKITDTEQLLSNKQPAQTIPEAQGIHREWKRSDDQVRRLQKQAESVDQEANPHDKSIAETDKQLAAYRTKLEKLKEEIERNVFLSRHYKYIHKAYNDRNKIKSFVFQDHVPFINSRLRHYLDVFGLDIQIEITPSLAISSNLWGYEFESGGERKRTDVAFMLAMYDFHEEMYGRQCNVLVLDEVDGRLDDDGIDSLISIIKNDLAGRVETILVISHRNMMFDTFGREIKVQRVDRFSTLQLN